MDMKEFKLKGNRVFRIQKIRNPYYDYIRSKGYHPRQSDPQEGYIYEGIINIKGNTWKFFIYADNLTEFKKKLIKHYNL